jgi:hypothetical protein
MKSENELHFHDICGRYFEAADDLADRVKAKRAANSKKAQA